ncbi:MAG: hypothetical protein LBP19_08280 [Treponema sp.]|nr:hypothetical protein [Treponema sp.]
MKAVADELEAVANDLKAIADESKAIADALNAAPPSASVIQRSRIALVADGVPDALFAPDALRIETYMLYGIIHNKTKSNSAGGGGGSLI